MRHRLPLALLALLAAGASLGAAVQERMKPKGPADFGSLHAGIATHFNAGHFGRAYADAQELLSLIGVRRANAIREALPAAPPQHEKVPFKEPKNAAMQNSALLAMTAGVGNMIEQNYKGPNGQIQVTVTADSPFVQMFQMLLGNPAMVGEGQEIIKYGETTGLLETQGRRKTLKILIENTLIDASFPDHSDEFVFAMFDQKAVDHIKATITN